MEIKFVLDDGAFTPERAHDTDAGFDLRSKHDANIIYGYEFDTGVHVEIPKGYVGYVQGRSGLNIKHDIICPTGVVDCGFTGAIRVKLYNMSNKPYTVNKGDKIAQLVIQPIAHAELIRVDSLEDTERGDNGFGSTGK